MIVLSIVSVIPFILVHILFMITVVPVIVLALGTVTIALCHYCSCCYAYVVLLPLFMIIPVRRFIVWLLSLLSYPLCRYSSLLFTSDFQICIMSIHYYVQVISLCFFLLPLFFFFACLFLLCVFFLFWFSSSSSSSSPSPSSLQYSQEEIILPTCTCPLAEVNFTAGCIALPDIPHRQERNLYDSDKAEWLSEGLTQLRLNERMDFHGFMVPECMFVMLDSPIVPVWFTGRRTEGHRAGNKTLSWDSGFQMCKVTAQARGCGHLEATVRCPGSGRLQVDDPILQ